MKKIMLSTVTLVLLGQSVLSAESTQVRLGVSSISGTYHLEDGYGNTSSDFDIDGNGFEISLVNGVSKRDGFNARSVLTLQSNNTTLETDVKTSDIMLLGEFEFAYNINEYVSPFIGFYGGIGVTDVPRTDESNLLTYDLGLLIGVSGIMYKDFGYYAKYTTGIKGYNIQDDTYVVRQRNTSMKLGVSYTF